MNMATTLEKLPDIPYLENSSRTDESFLKVHSFNLPLQSFLENNLCISVDSSILTDLSEEIQTIYRLLNENFVVGSSTVLDFPERIRTVILNLTETLDLSITEFQILIENSLLKEKTQTENRLMDINAYSPNLSMYAKIEREIAYCEIKSILDSAVFENIENGSEPEFIQSLFKSIFDKGYIGLAALNEALFSSDFDAEIISEVLRWLPKKSPVQNYGSILRILRYCLTSSSTWVRYGAALGLASLKDKHSAPYIREAISREKVSDLKHDLEHILSRLEGK